MGWGFRKSINLGGGLRLNLSKSGIGVSAGVPGFRVGTGPRGSRTRLTIPGTGLYYEERLGKGKKSANTPVESRQQQPVIPPAERVEEPEQHVKLSWWDSLTAPRNEIAFVAGVNYLLSGDNVQAVKYLKDSLNERPDCADAAWAAALVEPEKDAKLELIKTAVANRAYFGKAFEKYNIVITANLAVTNELTLRICNDLLGLTLFAAEVYQSRGLVAQAEELLISYPDQSLPTIRLSLVELYLSAGNYAKGVALAQNIKTDGPVGTLAKLYLGTGLLEMGYEDASAAILEKELSEAETMDKNVVWEFRYVLGKAYQALNRCDEAHRQWKLIYSANAEYKDINELLGHN